MVEFPIAQISKIIYYCTRYRCLSNGGTYSMGEWRQAFDRIMDQLYNHPEEMRERLLKKYDYSASESGRHNKTAIEMLKSMNY